MMKTRSGLGLGTPLVEASNPTEMTMAAIFAEFLGIDAVGVEDEFFALGGESFVALQISLAIEDRLGATIEASQVTACGTVRRLCEALAARG